MKSPALAVLICLLLMTSLLHGGEVEKETYLGIGVDKEFSPGADLFLDGQIKQRGILETDYFRKLEIGGKYDYSRRLSFRGSLKGVDLLGAEGWNRYYVPGVGASLEWSPSRFEVSFRNILELWHAFDDEPSELRVKQRIKISTPFDLKSIEIEPYISEEYLAAVNSDDHLIWNRVSGGNTFNLTEIVSVDLFYIWQRKNGSLEWRNAHVVGTKLRLSF